MDKESILARHSCRLSQLLVPECDNKRKNLRREYKHVDLDPALFLKQIEELSKYIQLDDPCISFIDVGCGIGTKLDLLTGVVRWNLCGVENTPEYVKFAKAHLSANQSAHKCDVLLKDALSFDYGQYDVVYFYRPISGVKQKRLEDRIHKTMKIGAYLLANLPEYCIPNRMPTNFKLLYEDWDDKQYIYRKESD